MMRHILYSLMLLILILSVFGCSSSNSDAPALGSNPGTTEVHIAGWGSPSFLHAPVGKADLRSCQGCHGFDFSGAGAAISCLACHPGAPPFKPGAGHPTWWNGDAFTEHQHFSNTVDTSHRLSWTTCAVAACHGTDLRSNPAEGASGPSCFSGAVGVNSCHATGPLASHAIPYVDPALHGTAAKDETAINEHMGNYCINCHGRPDNLFDGGFISDPQILNKPLGNCSDFACHPAAKAHPTNWVKANTATAGIIHSSPPVTDTLRTTGCALCHNTASSAGPGPMASAPSCYAGSRNGLVCHDTGPTGAGHDVPWLPDVSGNAQTHGTAAKADLSNCQRCHSDNGTGGVGTNPRFNLATGTMPTGCETCHAVNAAHPVDADLWTYNLVDGGGDGLRRTHFAAGNVTNACARCHNLTATDTGGSATACTTCHASVLTALDCTACHAFPPDGSVDAPVSVLGVDHVGRRTVSSGNAGNLHDTCALCHGAKDNGSGALSARPGYELFDRNSATLKLGGNHLDGSLEMNGPVGTGAGYNSTTFSCTKTCHATEVGHDLTSSGRTLVYRDYGAGSCDACHGYPPDGVTTFSTIPNPVTHTAGMLANHNDCIVCHGTKELAPAGSATHDPNINYDPTADHFDSNIHMNSTTNYDRATGGCNIACHSTGPNDAAHRVDNNGGLGSGLTIVTGDYGGGGCNSCHGYPPDGSTPPIGSPGGTVGVAHSNALFTQHGSGCALCHGTEDDGNGAHSPAANYTPTNDHQSGTIHINSLLGYDTATSGCTKACHLNDVAHQMANISNMTVAEADFGGLTCTSCHGQPPTPATKHAPGATAVDHSRVKITANHGECNLCHGYSETNGITDNTPNGDAYQLSYHYDGNIEMNGISATGSGQSAEYDQTTFGCAKACHANGAQFVLSDSGFNVQTHEYGGGSCTSCHDGSGAPGTATSISDSSPHALSTTLRNCEDCHGSHGGGTIEIPNNPAVGIDYTGNGEAGIALGVVGTAPGATEAEICWNCHASFLAGDGEWGTNNKLNTGNMTYDYGTLDQNNWIGATWTSAIFSYKTGTVQSIHTANPQALGGPSSNTGDTVGQIRCSYCHDVHDLNNAPGDTLSGNPYLRGTWMGNPYREDGAPRNTNTYSASLNRFGAVPRGNTANTELGGYQIDQNNGSPTTGWTLTSSAGLCTLCHGTDVDNLNQFGTAATDWVGTNGHSNAVIGGTSSNSSNIFSNNDRNPNGVTTARSGGNPSMAYVSSQDRGYGFRSVIGAEDEGWDLAPDMNHPDRPYGFNSYNWGATVNAGTTDPQYHKFSCSKCHNPHASRLPRLMITNCLDTNHNTWDTKAGVELIPAAGTSNLGGTANIGIDNGNLPLSNATSAQNCHRVADPQFGNSTGAGWNNVTPWQEF